MFTSQDFRAPRDGEVALCVVDGVLHSTNYEFANVNVFTKTVEKHPQIHITRNVLHPASIREESRALFLPVDEPLLKKLSKIYIEQGFLEALTAASVCEYIVVSKFASITLKGLKIARRIANSLNSRLKDCNPHVINEYSATQNWSTSPVRCFVWHNYCSKLAVAGSDDVVRIYSTDSDFIPLLKCQQQKNITCLAWRPMCLTDIAVGCRDLIIIWTVDPTSVVTRPSITNAIIVQRNEHRGIIGLAWSPRGDVLASAALCDSKVLVWDVELDRTSALKRPGYAGNAVLKWSSTGERLFCATNGLVFRVWDCVNWHVERWTVQSGRVRAACWSDCGGFMLFATSQEAVIYGLTFQTSDVFKAKVDTAPNLAVALFSMSRGDLDGVYVGGLIRSMDTDPKGEHLAVLFEDSDVVAVFSVRKLPILGLLPNFVINGLPEERPNIIEFQKNFEYGACLSVAWSSGRLQHFPIVSTVDRTPNRTNQKLPYSALS